MIITENAKKVFEEAIANYNKPIIHLGLQVHHCGGVSLDLQLIEENQATRIVEINGLRIDISEKDEARMTPFEFDAVDGKISVRTNAPIQPEEGEGSCCHGGGHHEGGCCHGEGHGEGGCCHGEGHEEGECCCGDDCDCDSDKGCCCHEA